MQVQESVVFSTMADKSVNTCIGVTGIILPVSHHARPEFVSKKRIV